MVRINGLFHLLINGVYRGYNPLTNLLLTSWDIQVHLFNSTKINSKGRLVGTRVGNPVRCAKLI